MVETFYDCHEPTKETRLQCFLGLDINDLVKQQQVKALLALRAQVRLFLG
jgi:hypothetical protein